MGDSLPEKFDLVVVGTGLVESMVAAAAARLGHSVLHLDTASYYGGQWASFTWDGLQTWVKEQACEGNSNVKDVQTEGKKQGEEEEMCVLQEGERLVALNGKSKVQNLVETWHEHADADGKDLAFVENLHSEDDTTDRDKNAASQVPDWSKEEIEKHSRRFNIDLVPRLLFARGEMVELLISSNISRLEIFHLDLVHVLCRQVYRVQGCDQGTDHAEWQSRAGSQLEGRRVQHQAHLRC